jgi:hypothetical protein
MIRDHLNRALVISAGLLLAAAAAAQAPQAAAPAKANAAPQAQDAPGKQKPEDKGKTTDVKADSNKTDTAKDGKDNDPSKASADRATRVKSQHDAERAKLSSLVHGPMNQAMKEELQRHARRMARLERIKSLATESKDKDVVDRASKLIDKETTRHDKWITTYAATAQANPNTDTKAGAR